MAAIVRASSLERDPLKRDFKNFLWRMWMDLFGNAPTVLIYEIGDRLQHGPDRDIIMGFRGVSKSYATVGYAIWSLDRDRDEKVLNVSGSGAGAKGNAILAYALINNFDWLSHLKPRADQRQSADAFDVAGSKPQKSASFTSRSLFGQITGEHCSLIIPDDVETPNTSETEAKRAELRTRFAELGGAILIPEVGRVKCLGTPQHEDTIYKELVDEHGYALCMWPCYYPLISSDPKQDEMSKYGTWLAPSIAEAVKANPELAHTPTEPVRFPESELWARQKEYGTTEFDRQFRLWMNAGGDQDRPLHLRDLIVIDIERPSPGKPLMVPDDLTWSPAPNLVWDDIPVDGLEGDSKVYAPARVGVFQEPELKVLVIDPSGEGLDETAWKVLAQHLGRVFLVHQNQRLEGFSAGTMRAIADDAKLYGVHKIIIEKNFGQGMFGELLRPVLMLVDHPCEIEELMAGNVQKEIRIIDTLEPVVTEHRLVVNAAVLRGDFRVNYPQIEEAKRRPYRFTYQFSRITKKRGCLAHDDRVDVLASGVTNFLGALRRVLLQSLRESQEANLKLEAEKIMATRRKQGLAVLGIDGQPIRQPTTRLGGVLKQMAEGALAETPYSRLRRGQRV